MNVQQHISLIVTVLLLYPVVGSASSNNPVAGSARSNTFLGPTPVPTSRIATPLTSPDPTPVSRLRLAKKLRQDATPSAAPDDPMPPLAGQSATLLSDGRLLRLGGEDSSGETVSAAYVTAAGTNGKITKLASHLLHARAYHTATVLPSGFVLIAGGLASDAQLATQSELFDPATNSFAAFPTGLDARARQTATLLIDGTLLIAGGANAAGEPLDTVERWDYRTLKLQVLNARLLEPRQGHTATLQSDGTVRLHGGTSLNGAAVGNDEIIDPASGSIQVVSADARAQKTPALQIVRTLPADQATGVPVDATVSVQFSSAVPVQSVTVSTVTLTTNGQPVPASVVASEEGKLAFLTPKAPLEPGTPYTLNVSGVQASDGSTLPDFESSFTTESSSVNALPASPSGTSVAAAPSSKIPDAKTGGAQAGDEPAVAPLEARPGLTALSGETRTVAGKYLPNVAFTLDCNGQTANAKSDSLGRFLIVTDGSGHCEMEIDGTTAGSDSSQDYGRYFPGVDLVAGKTNVLPYTVWLTLIDHQHEVTIPSPTTSEVVVTAPHLKGLELHLPPGTVIRDYNGQVMTKIGMTRIPIRRPPFPLPANVPVPVYFTIQPGGSFVEVGGSRYAAGKGAQLIYPNTHRAPAGTEFNFWDYDPDGTGWYSYGTGHVDKSRKDIVPDPGVVIHRFSGAMVATPGTAAPLGPNPGIGCPAILNWLHLCSPPLPARPPAPGTPGHPGRPGRPGAPHGPGGPGKPDGPDPDPKPGDPLDPATGLFVYRTTDYVLPDVIPFVLTRTYRQGDPISRAFGVGTSQDLDMFLTGDFQTYQYADLITSDGSRIHFTRTSPGTFWGDAVFTNTSNAAFFGSTIAWGVDGYFGWKLTLKNGAALYFPEAAGQTNPLKAALAQVKDRYGNSLTLTRDSRSGALTKVTTQNGRFVSFTYDGNGRVLQTQDNLGRTTSYAYDEGGRLIQVIDPSGAVTTYTYDANDQMLTITDSRSNAMLTNQYDSEGRVVFQTLADSSTFAFAYTEDVNGNITQTQITDQRSNLRTLSFSSSGYFTGGLLLTDVRAVGKPEQQTFTYSWQSGTGLLRSMTDPLSRTTSYTYDSMGNLTSTTWLSGTSSAVTSSATYDSTFNQILTSTDSMDRTATFTYDAQGNLTQITSPLGVVLTQTFNTSGQILTRSTGPAGPTTFSYSNGLLTGVSDSLGNHSSRTVDAIGRTTTLVDPLGNSTAIAYDNGSRPTRITGPLAAQTQFSYDGNGNVLSVSDANSASTVFTYDSMNRPISRQDPLLAVAHSTYDASGNLATFTDRKGQVTHYTYDALDRLTLIQYADSSTVAFTYDAAGRLTQIADSISGTIYHSYDGLDDLLSESGPMGTVTYSYNNSGQRTSMTVATQPSIAYSYDADGRLSSITQGSSSVAITYDAAARRSTLALPGGTTASYTYDSSSRLTELDYTQGSTLLGNLTYSYDAAGRRTAVGGTLAGTGLPNAMTDASYDAANRLTEWNGSTLTYDSNGNLLSDGTLTYGWNARNQLVSLTSGTLSAAFQYDALGRRQAKAINSSQTNFLFDGGNTVQEQAIDGSVIANIITGLGVDENYVRNDATGSQAFLTDPLQSTLALVGSGGTFTAQYTYDPFGNTAATGSSGNTAQFTGRENDGTGLYFYRARYYSPSLQRFISQDPIGFKGGLNLYAYAGSNPISWRDPMGTDPHREPNPYKGAAADALSALSSATGNRWPGLLGTALSLWNDPSLPTYLLAMAGLADPLGDAIAATSLTQDLGGFAGQFATDNVLAPIFDGAPPQEVDPGDGGPLIPNPVLPDECQDAGVCP